MSEASTYWSTWPWIQTRRHLHFLIATECDNDNFYRQRNSRTTNCAVNHGVLGLGLVVGKLQGKEEGQFQP